MRDRFFPTGFLWGSSTSPYQIEGGNVASDWAEWERRGATGDTCGDACDGYARFAQDAALAAALGHNAYRFGVEWARVEPADGVFDGDAIAHYADVARACADRGLTTFVCLNHFTLPAWVARRGGWLWADAPARFERFVRAVAPGMAPHTHAWLTLNEPTTLLLQGYLRAKWPPGGCRDVVGAVRAGRAMAEAHRRAYSALKGVAGAGARVGLAHAAAWVHPTERRPPGSGIAARFGDWLANRWFPDMVSDSLDFLGVQYYSEAPVDIRGVRFGDGDPPRTDMHWRIAPEGLASVVSAAYQRYRVPVYVTENGIADGGDRQRTRFLLDHLRWLHQAIEQGADVRGYFHWSLMDNFEWAKGFEPRFGLCETDYVTLERHPRPSSEVYARIATRNTIDAEEGAGLTYENGRGDLGPA